MRAFSQIREFLGDIGVDYREDATGRDSTTFRAGGGLALLAEPDSCEKACRLLSFAEACGTPCYIIGNGSNLLIPDSGADMLFIKLSGALEGFRREGASFICGAGASMAAVARQSVAEGFMGLEWAAGIPGTVGGAVAMNAGAYGGEIKQVLKSIRAFGGGKLVEIEADQNAMGYRRSEYSFPNMTVLEATFGLLPDDGGAKARMDDYNARRREKQPLAFPSAGSTFKRPEGYFAGALIEGAGLKGFSVGGASVSEKHAGFIINSSGATASDIIELIEKVQSIVFDKYGVHLEPEVKIL